VKLAATGSRILVWRALQKLANALVVLAVAQGLGPAGNGRYSLTLMLVTVAAALLAGGVGLASVPLLRQGTPPARRVLAAQRAWIGGVALALGGLARVLRATPLWSWLHDAIGWDLSLLVAAAAVTLAILGYETANYDLLAAGAVVVGTRVAALRALVLLFAMGTLLAASRLDLAAAICSFAVVHVLATLYLIWHVRATWPHAAAAAADDGAAASAPLGWLVGHLVRRGWLGQLSALSYLLLLRLDQLILEQYRGVAAVGIYSLAAWAAELLWLVPEALNPLLVHSSADDRNEQRDLVSARAVRLGLSVTTAVAVPLLVLAEPLLGLLRGGDYLPAVAPLRALLPGVVAFAPGAILAGDFIGRGRSAWNTQASAITVAVNVALCLLWIPRLGILGAAWASTVAYTFGSAIMLWRFRRITGLSWRTLLVARPADFRL